MASKKVKIKQTNQGCEFTLLDADKATVFVRGEYNRSEGKYEFRKRDGEGKIRLMRPNETIYIYI